MSKEIPLKKSTLTAPVENRLKLKMTFLSFQKYVKAPQNHLATPKSCPKLWGALQEFINKG